MSKGRSPNYPSLTLADAIERARQVYKEEHTHAASRDVMAKDMGYSSLNGASLTVLAALRSYGLIEDAGDGMKISDDAVSIFELKDGDHLKASAFERCAFRPALFEELRSQFPETMPSDANLRHSLIMKRFLPKAADDAIRVYRENLKLVRNGDNPYNGVEEPMQAHPPTPRNDSSALSKPLQQATRSYSFDISIPRDLKGELKIIGTFSKEDLEKLRKALTGQIAMIEAALED